MMTKRFWEDAGELLVGLLVLVFAFLLGVYWLTMLLRWPIILGVIVWLVWRYAA